MRVLFSGSSSFWVTREAVVLARELGAAWASVDLMPIRGEPDCWIEEGDDREEMYSLSHLVPRHDPMLLSLYERMGDAMVPFGRVHVSDVPDDLVYSVSSYSGEWIDEVHRMWTVQEPDGVQSETVYCYSKETTFEELFRRYGQT